MPDDTEVTTSATEDTEAPADTTVTTPEVTDDTKVEDTDDENPDEEEDADDPIVSFQKTWESTKLAQVKEDALREAREQLMAEQEANRRAQLDTQQRESLNTSYADSVKAMRKQFESLTVYDEDGEPVKWDDQTFQKFVAPWQEHNTKMQTAGVTKGYSDWSEAVVKVLPASAREEFAKKAHQKPLAEYLKTFAELYAPQTDFAKTAKADTEVKLKAAEARGFTKGQKAPVGTPRQGNDKPTEARGEVIEIGNLYDAARALAKGQIDDLKYVEYHKKYTS